MTLNTQTNKSYQSPTSSFKTKSWNWKELKKHALLVIAVVCLALWLAALNGKVSWAGKLGECLPLIGGLALVGEQLIKLIS